MTLTRSKQIIVRVTEVEHARIKEAAEKAGQPMTEFMRLRALADGTEQYPSTVFQPQQFGAVSDTTFKGPDPKTKTEKKKRPRW